MTRIWYKLRQTLFLGASYILIAWTSKVFQADIGINNNPTI
ncbi:hypothetical protein PN499_01435 [Kamptonema animale CS-326]|nr:hypothetical protein [Kamptonema animale]MDB9509867.1 hypothetical protein [Kamptonema animale CS-326]